MNTEAILRKELRQDCKTFTRRFDSDRRLQNLNKFNRLQVLPLVAHFRLYHCWLTSALTDASWKHKPTLENADEIARAGMIRTLTKM
jgi:hypothetical protein